MKTKTAWILAIAMGGVVGTAHAAKKVKVCGTERSVDDTYLDCYSNLKNIFQLKKISELTKLKQLKINPQRSKVLNDKGMKYLKPVGDTLTQLELHYQNITSKGVAHLEGFAELEELNLWETKVDDNVFKTLATMPKLKFVDLSKTNVTGSGFKHLAGHKTLKDIRLRGSKVEKKYLADLGKIPNLSYVDLDNTDIGEDDLDVVLEQVPDAKITTN